MPNRRERLAARAIARKHPSTRKTAIHEAGHAVGRFLMAERLGYTIEKSIDRIELHSVAHSKPANRSFDGQVNLIPQGVTYGPRWSRELEAFIRSAHPHMIIRPSEIVGLYAKARDAKIDIDGWWRAKAFLTILGPMAEAKLLEKPFEMVWRGYEAEGDIKDTIQEGLDCSMTPEQIESALDEITVDAQQGIDSPEIWRAIRTLADKLKPPGMSGREAVAIIKHAIEP